jgi:hypothetical protein
LAKLRHGDRQKRRICRSENARCAHREGEKGSETEKNCQSIAEKRRREGTDAPKKAVWNAHVAVSLQENDEGGNTATTNRCPTYGRTLKRKGRKN